MTVVVLPTDTGSQARTILHHSLQHGDLAGRDAARAHSDDASR